VISGTSRVGVAGARVSARSIATGASLAEAVTGPTGLALLEAEALTGAVTVEAVGPVTQVVMGVRTDELVISLPSRRSDVRTVAGTVRGVPADSRVSVAVGTAVSILRTVELDEVVAAPCTASGEATCSFELGAAFSETALAAATITTDAGDVTGFVVGEVGVAGQALEVSVAPQDLPVSLPAATGLTGIVGVPGVARGGALVLLPQTPASPGLFEVPSLEGALADASYWVIVEARPTMGVGGADPNARSVLFARGARTAAELPRWTAWLPAPEASLDADGAVTFEAVPGADAHAVDWIDARGEVVGSAWLIDDTVLFVDALVPAGVAAADVARVRVRAIESSAPPRAGVFDAGELEEGIERFSERDITP